MEDGGQQWTSPLPLTILIKRWMEEWPTQNRDLEIIYRALFTTCHRSR